MKMTETFDHVFVSMIVAQIAIILEDFHKRGFIYRDIKASNFVIDSLGKIILVDLGKAKKTNG
jgi:serine/threonine protein kinase